MHTVVETFNIVLPIIQFVIFIWLWRLVFVQYQLRALQMRRGVYFFDKKKYSERHCTRFIGYQTASMTVSTLTINVGIGLFIAAPLTAAGLVLAEVLKGSPEARTAADGTRERGACACDASATRTRTNRKRKNGTTKKKTHK